MKAKSNIYSKKTATEDLKKMKTAFTAEEHQPNLFDSYMMSLGKKYRMLKNLSVSRRAHHLVLE